MVDRSSEGVINGKMGTFLVSPLRGQKGTHLLQVRPLLLGNEECPHFPVYYARPAFESVGVWKYSLSEASCSISRLSSDMRPSAVLIGMQSWQRESPQGWREYSQYWIAPASRPSAMSHKSASLSLSAILLARSTVLEKAASKVSAMGSMGRSIGTRGGNRNGRNAGERSLCSTQRVTPAEASRCAVVAT